MPDHHVTLHEGQRIGNYKLIRQLGKGGFAEVYLGLHVHLNTLAAIKLLLKTQLGADEIEKFRREARIVAALRHPHIVRVHDFGVEPNEPPYLILDYAPNGSLRQRHLPGSVLSPDRVLHYLRQVGEALDFAHSQGIIHRDIKPDNMLLGQHDEVLLSDFGIATVAASSSLDMRTTPHMEGTLPYMAPEQMQNKPQRASDQYALAIVVYEWLCGRRPFDGTLPEIVAGQLNTPPPPLRSLNPAIPAELEAVILKALAKHPAQRYPSIRDFVNHYERAIPSSYFMHVSNKPDSYQGQNAAPAFATIDPQPADLTIVATAAIELAPDFTSSHRPLTPTPPGVTPTTNGPLRNDFDASPAPHSTYATQLMADKQPHQREIIANKPTSRRNFLLGMGATSLLALGTAFAIEQGPRSRLPTLLRSTAISNTYQVSSAEQATTQANIPTGTTFYVNTGHSDIVDAVAWSPDGHYLVSGSRDKTAQVIDANTGNHIYTYTQHSGAVYSVAWSPDTKHVVTGSFDQTVQIWDVPSGKRQYIFNDLKRLVSSVAWFSSGSPIAAAGLDSDEFKIYDTITGHTTYDYHINSDFTYTVAWSPDGKYIAAGSGGGTGDTLQVWDVITSSRVASYNGHTGAVYSVAWSPDGKLIASAGQDKTVHIWNPSTGKQILVYDEHNEAVNTVAWSPTGDHLASGSNDNTVCIWTNTGVTTFIYKNHLDFVRSVSWSPDGKRVASASADKTVRVWQAT